MNAWSPIAWFLLLSALASNTVQLVRAAEPPTGAAPGDTAVARYFERQTAALEARCLAEVRTLEDWQKKKAQYREQLFEMLSLSPQPERTDLKATVTSRIDHPLVRVENLHFQSMPGLYVTANLYLPKQITKPVPAVLYVCGHARAITNGVSFGNKTAYQHHGIWFARNGYVCLVIDTVQLGEIQGIHHGTYREGMWWWNARGYTSAGVEAWNSIRAIDYLVSRPEVDSARIGVTGRSGGGAYSWWLAALDDRIKAVAPVAGLTDLRNHVVDGVVEGHCDCMFVLNTYRWDYAQVAALVAPRPLLICNSDKDTIFPLDGVQRIHQQVRRIYQLHNAADKLGLLITEGPHKDTQDLQLPVFRWFNRHLKGEDPLIEMAATKLFEPQQLKVFSTIPAGERTSKIHETFVPAAAARLPESRSDWEQQRRVWIAALRAKSFQGWPEVAEPLDANLVRARETNGLRFEAFDFTSEADVRLPLHLVSRAGVARPARVQVRIADAAEWAVWCDVVRGRFGETLESGGAAAPKPSAIQIQWFQRALDELGNIESVLAVVAPRGVGPTAWNPNERKQIQIRRRFMLLGQTLDGMRVWDIRRSMQALRSIPRFAQSAFALSGSGAMGINALYATLFEAPVESLRLEDAPASHQEGPDYLNVLRVLDIPQAAAMVAETSRLEIVHPAASGWDYPSAVLRRLGWSADQFQVRAREAASSRR